jgi:hypothetical protein
MALINARLDAHTTKFGNVTHYATPRTPCMLRLVFIYHLHHQSHSSGILTHTFMLARPTSTMPVPFLCTVGHKVHLGYSPLLGGQRHLPGGQYFAHAHRGGNRDRGGRRPTIDHVVMGRTVNDPAGFDKESSNCSMKMIVPAMGPTTDLKQWKRIFQLSCHSRPRHSFRS